MAHLLFQSIGLPIDVADNLEFTSRLTSAEIAYHAGSHAAIREEEVVRAVNNLASRLGAPAWAQTDGAEVRKLRMRMLTLYPDLMVSQALPDKQGHYEAISAKLSPMEASYLACSLVFQKVTNEEYQFPERDRVQYLTMGAKSYGEEHLRRSKVLDDLLHARSQALDLGDLITASEHFFDDLGLRRQTASLAYPTTELNESQGSRGGR